MQTEKVVVQTKKWIYDVIIGCNFCPFAAPVFKAGSIAYDIIEDATMDEALQALFDSFIKLDEEQSTETLFLIFPDSFQSFEKYLLLVELSEALLAKEGYEGVYQIASFHPEYLFAGSSNNDPENFTNRSPYPMLHLLREESVSRAVDSFPGTEKIPQRNIKFAKQKGLLYMQTLRSSCFEA
jgi:hypothetical protein